MSHRAVTGLGCIAAVVVAGCGAHQPNAATSDQSPPAPGPIIATGPAHGGDPLTAAQRAAARATTRRFLSGYVPYLYGRARASTVAPVSTSVARTLRVGRARITPAQAARHPRVTGLSVIGQSRASALATVTISDGGPAPYRLTLTVERRAGRWLIADVGDDD